MTRSFMIKRFGQVLTGGALDWYASLPPNSLEFLADLVDKFKKAHTGARKAEKRMEDIFNIKQRRDETLQGFFHRFHKHRNTLTQIEEKWAGIPFRHALNPDRMPATKDLAKHLIEYPTKTWDDIYYQYCSKIRIEQDIINPIMRKSSPSTRDTSTRSNSRKSNGDRTHRRERYDPYYSRGSCEALDKLGNMVKWPGKIKSDPSKRNLEHFCEFHKGHGHKTEDFHALRLAVADLLEQGHLTELLLEKGEQAYYQNREQGAPPSLPEPKPVVNFITGGTDINITRGLDVNKVIYTSGV
ncbi:uncharacterized protein LOC132637326 [Lycium barbarum]|uniref:uncharacterized protein LOC132637326 n=1 Tax=Lycium barbarum TaxID=112863 RepID=UPI00293E2D98|nr:uncharacterized protein LOC132637326 [Lycium barbarum]